MAMYALYRCDENSTFRDFTQAYVQPLTPLSFSLFVGRYTDTITDTIEQIIESSHRLIVKRNHILNKGQDKGVDKKELQR